MTTHVITGAGSGIGAEVARRLADRGDRQVLIARSVDCAAHYARDFGERHQTLVLDLSDSASKFGLRALADALRAEESEHGFRVTRVYPGRTATPIQEAVHHQEGKTYHPGEWIKPGTVAATVLHVLDLPDDATVPDVSVQPR